ncbi:DUF973 family protein [Stygiolobus azoricus]|uniref:DUF973 family protein n=1 Tax=Stygiolobus azoricus TaxID=41675 RepID=A0A650CPK3_9CREN|nr:DUF973 family protein [Stygiolobus azoricus]QGR19769.1 DUF973 family protein [Stygiolobus azoricus]
MKIYLEKYNIEKRVEDELESLDKDEIEVLEKTGKINDSFYWGLNFFFGGVGGDLGLVIVLAIAVVFDTYHPHSLLYFLLAFLFLIIGEMILGIELYGIGQAYNEGLLKKGGILVTSVVTSIIGFILAYMGLGNVISKLKSGFVTTTITQQSVQSSIHQIGVGSLNAYGEAHIVIYTPSPTKIVSAEIVGKSIVSSFIIPNLLSPGNNDVTIHFGTITGLTPNATYTIKLTLGDGKTIETTVSYKP